MTAKSYPTEVLLSISTGRLLCDFSDMHECIEFLTGEPVFTHQLAFKPFVEHLKVSVLGQHPILDSPEVAVTALGKLILMLDTEAGKANPGALIKGCLLYTSDAADERS